MRKVSFETAKLAAEKGYDEDCDSAYDIYGNIIDIDNYGLGIIPEYCCPAPYQAELQEWLRNEHGVSVLVYLDETLSYIWTITCLHPRASIMEYHQSNEVWCGHYENCLEAGLQAALRLMYNNLMHVVELASGATTGNITHKVATIKGLCRRCIDFINEYGLE